MSDRHLFYKDRVGWKCVDQCTHLVYEFINPMPEYKIKHIYCCGYSFIVWYWPKNNLLAMPKSTEHIIAILNFTNQYEFIRNNAQVTYKRLSTADIFVTLYCSNITVDMYICRLPEQITAINYHELIFITLRDRIVVVGHSPILPIFNFKAHNILFEKLQWCPKEVQNIYTDFDRTYIVTTDNKIYVSGYHSHTSMVSGEEVKPIGFGLDLTSRLSSFTVGLKLKKIIVCETFTLFWYANSAKFNIYKTATTRPKKSLEYELVHGDYTELCDIQTNGYEYILIWKQKIIICTSNHRIIVEFDLPLQNVYLCANTLFAKVGDKVRIFTFTSSDYSQLELIDTCGKINKSLRWFDQLPYAHDNWDILKTLFVGHYLCFESPLYKTKLPMDILKIIIDFLILAEQMKI